MLRPDHVELSQDAQVEGAQGGDRALAGSSGDRRDQHSTKTADAQNAKHDGPPHVGNVSPKTRAFSKRNLPTKFQRRVGDWGCYRRLVRRSTRARVPGKR